MRTSSEIRDSEPAGERRQHQRHTLILRVGVLEQEGRSSLCLLKNISSTGVLVRRYTRVIADAPVSIRVADERPVDGQLLWVKDDTAGISFHEELDPAALLRVQQKLKPHRRRVMPRVAVNSSATLRSGGRTLRVVVWDISSLGARVKTRSSLTPGDRAMLTFDNLPTIGSYVRWSDGDEAGLSFDVPIPMQIIASWIGCATQMST